MKQLTLKLSENGMQKRALKNILCDNSNFLLTDGVGRNSAERLHLFEVHVF